MKAPSVAWIWISTFDKRPTAIFTTMTIAPTFRSTPVQVSLRSRNCACWPSYLAWDKELSGFSCRLPRPTPASAAPPSPVPASGCWAPRWKCGSKHVDHSGAGASGAIRKAFPAPAKSSPNPLGRACRGFPILGARPAATARGSQVTRLPACCQNRLCAAIRIHAARSTAPA